MPDSSIGCLPDSSTETWRVVPGTDGLYSASTNGRIRSEPSPTPRCGRPRGRLIAPTLDRKGYPRFRICLFESRRSIRVHSVVALAFLGPRPQGYQVNHKDGNKENNRPTNLEYITCLDNVRHCWEMGLHGVAHTIGVENNNAKLTEEKVRKIRLDHPRKSYRRLSREHGVSVQAIAAVVKGRTWKHVGMRESISETWETKHISRFRKHVRTAAKMRCYWCGKNVPIEDRHLDHIVPQSRGGSKSVFNVCCSCSTCNMSKNNKLPAEFTGQHEIIFT